MASNIMYLFKRTGLNLVSQTDQFQHRQVHGREGGEEGREEDDREPTFES